MPARWPRSTPSTTRSNSSPRRSTRRSVEYCSYILEAVVTGKPFRLMGNVRNDGYITNLPRRLLRGSAHLRGRHAACIRPSSATCRRSARPPAMTNVNVQTLAADAALEGDPEHVVHAVAMDPLTGAVCTLKEIREMCSEMLEAAAPVAAAVRGQVRAPDADHPHPARLQARGRPARPGAGDQQALRRADRAEDGREVTTTTRRAPRKAR